MKALEAFLDKVLSEKLKERETILEEAEKERERIISKFKEEARIYFKDYEARERLKIEAQIKEALFKTKLEKKREILEEKEALKKEALNKLGEYISQDKSLLPKKRIVSSDKEEEVYLEIEEFLDLIVKKAAKLLEEVFDEKV